MDKIKEKYNIPPSSNPQEIAQVQEETEPVTQSPYGAVDFLVKKNQKEQDDAYYEEQKRLEKQKRLNALTDTFRLLIDTVGYSKGGSVQRREPNTQIDRSLENVRQSVLANRERAGQPNLNLALQKAKETEALNRYNIQRKNTLDDYKEKLASADEYKRGILQQQLDDSLAEIEARKQSDLEKIGITQKGQYKRAMDTQSQINKRFDKNLQYKEQNKPRSSAKETGLYELTSEDGSPIAKLNEGGLDRMASEIIKSPNLAQEYDVIVNRYGDGLDKQNAKKAFVQKYWRSSPQLQQLGMSLNRSSSLQTTPVNTVDLSSLETKLGTDLDIIDNEYTNIESQTLVNGQIDYTARFNKLYNLLMASKKLSPQEAEDYANEIVYNE
jgi:hypothetical protein